MTIVLMDTGELIRARMSGAAATTNPACYASYGDEVLGRALVVGNNGGAALSGASNVTLVAAPTDADARRLVSYISIANVDTAAVTVVVEFYDGSTARELARVTLAVNSTLEYVAGLGWRVINTAGQALSSASGGGTPGGSDTHIQYNDGGAFGGEAGFTYSKATDQATFPGVTVTQDVILSGEITPAQITANTDNYAPTGFATATVIRISSDANRNITGLAGGAAGRMVTLINVGSFNIMLANDAASTAANRFLFGDNIYLGPSHAATLWYDTTSARWRTIALKFTNLASAASVFGTLSTGLGGTGLTSYARGDLLRASAANVLAALGIGAAGTILRSDAGADDPEWTNEYDRPLDVATAEAEIVNSAARTNLYAFTVPANLLGTNGLVILKIYLHVLNNSGATAYGTITIQLGATDICSFSNSGNKFPDAGARTAGELIVVLKGDGATNAQWASGMADFATSTSGSSRRTSNQGTAAEDSTGALALEVDWQFDAAHASLSVKLEAAELIFVPAI